MCNEKCDVVCTSKTPTKLWTAVGVFFLSFELIIQIIGYDTCYDRTNDNSYDEKCNVHLYITPPFMHRKCNIYYIYRKTKTKEPHYK